MVVMTTLRRIRPRPTAPVRAAGSPARRPAAPAPAARRLRRHRGGTPPPDGEPGTVPGRRSGCRTCCSASAPPWWRSPSSCSRPSTGASSTPASRACSWWRSPVVAAAAARLAARRAMPSTAEALGMVAVLLGIADVHAVRVGLAPAADPALFWAGGLTVVSVLALGPRPSRPDPVPADRRIDPGAAAPALRARLARRGARQLPAGRGGPGRRRPVRSPTAPGRHPGGPARPASALGADRGRAADRRGRARRAGRGGVRRRGPATTVGTAVCLAAAAALALYVAWLRAESERRARPRHPHRHGPRARCRLVRRRSSWPRSRSASASPSAWRRRSSSCSGRQAPEGVGRGSLDPGHHRRGACCRSRCCTPLASMLVAASNVAEDAWLLSGSLPGLEPPARRARPRSPEPRSPSTSPRSSWRRRSARLGAGRQAALGAVVAGLSLLGARARAAASCR